MYTLIKNVNFKENIVDVLIHGNRIEKIAPNIYVQADKIIDGSNKAISPGFVNTHTHAAMSLFRGYADDMLLEEWLTKKIWPHEARLTPELIYTGSKLACLEMIKTGTTCFSDMYMHMPSTLKATDEMGLRAALGILIMDPTFKQTVNQVRKKIEESYSLYSDFSDRIQITLAPHAVYTVSEDILKMLKKFSDDNNVLIHIHANETRKELSDCIKHHGYTPIKWLDKIGFLSERVILAHCLWVSTEEMEIIERAGCKVVHNPNSNLKLASGYKFKFVEMKERGICVGLGTDGDSSSNNLDMIDTMKTASLIAKAWRFDPTANTAKEMFNCATRNGGVILRQDIGTIEEGMLADVILLDLKNTAFTPNFHFTSNLVYSANGYCVDTVICDGKVLMENKKVRGEEKILEDANEAARILFS